MFHRYGYQVVLNSDTDYFNYIEFTITDNKVKILVVDDEDFWLTTLKKFIEMATLFESEVYTAKDGTIANQILQKYPIQVVICDYNLPQIKGTELLENMRMTYPDLIRIMITGQESRDIAIEAINRAQIHYFIDKPPDPDELEKIIHQEVKKRHHR